MVEGEVAYFGLLDVFRERCFSILTLPHCGTNDTVVLCKWLFGDDARGPPRVSAGGYITEHYIDTSHNYEKPSWRKGHPPLA